MIIGYNINKIQKIRLFGAVFFY